MDKEFKLTMTDGVELDIQILKDADGNDKYLVNDQSGTYLPFTWTPNATGESEAMTADQLRVLEQLKKEINK